ncbi:MAG: mannose-6-phosphate isomerase, class I [Desulfobacterales bacterium]|nr:MAG: mannose-6-phosphate isomerase, class I [Desulfobacterales bacterium]
MLPMDNPILPYAWGSRTAIAELSGRPPSETPEAELWMGAHPKAPSRVRVNGEWYALDRLIAADPASVMGDEAAARFPEGLPYLFKVLAAAAPLSIQAHPDKDQAGEGFRRENEQGIPLSAPHRNYRDDNHKPELITALTPFWGLNGFRFPSEICSLLGAACPVALGEMTARLAAEPEDAALRFFYQGLMELDAGRREAALSEALEWAGRTRSAEAEWVRRLHEFWPGDMGVLSPLYLNLVCLAPGQSMYLPAGQLHAYLDGTGIELMANSDNVLRGGLTPKHMDIPELMRVLRFSAGPPKVRDGLPAALPEEGAFEAVEFFHETPAREFLLSMLRIPAGRARSHVVTGPEILLCVSGEAEVRSGGMAPVRVFRGHSVLATGRAGSVHLSGPAVLYRAAVPPAAR